MYYNNINQKENSESIYQQIGKNESLMSENDHNFLCGLIEQYRPQKILEVGVYAGGTTVAILDCLQCLGLNETEVYSVDLAETVENGKKVGYMLDEADAFLRNKDKHYLYTGVTAPEVLEDIVINEKFDFVIIDTTHYLPGEILDFLACYPFMKEKAIVVLHDVMLNQRDKHRASATKVVFDVVVGKKIWNWQSEKYPNIAAIQLNDDTSKYIMDLISSLSLSWYYYPGNEILCKYENIIKKYYSEEAYLLYENIMQKNLEWWNATRTDFLENIESLLKYIKSNKENRVYIYGTGKLGRHYLSILQECGLDKQVAGFIVSDNQNLSETVICGKPIFVLSSIEYRQEKDLIINSVNSTDVEELLRDRGILFIKPRGLWKESISLYC